MPGTIAINQIEQQIESLPPVEQIRLLERAIRHLKQLLTVQPAAQTQNNGRIITEQLNYVYLNETTEIDSRLAAAQFSAIGRETW